MLKDVEGTFKDVLGVEEYCRLLQYISGRYIMLEDVKECCRMLQDVARCCRML